MNMRDFRRLASASAKSPSAENSLASSTNLVSISAAVNFGGSRPLSVSTDETRPRTLPTVSLSAGNLWQSLDLTGGNSSLQVVKNSELWFAERLESQWFAIAVLPDVVCKPESCKSGIDLRGHVGSVANICRMILGFSTALVIE